jgi:hypothetical protein
MNSASVKVWLPSGTTPESAPPVLQATEPPAPQDLKHLEFASPFAPNPSAKARKNSALLRFSSSETAACVRRLTQNQ